MSTYQTIVYFEYSDLYTFIEGMDIKRTNLCTFF